MGVYMDGTRPQWEVSKSVGRAHVLDAVPNDHVACCIRRPKDRGLQFHRTLGLEVVQRRTTSHLSVHAHVHVHVHVMYVCLYAPLVTYGDNL